MARNLFINIVLMAFLLLCSHAIAECPTADLTGDCIVNLADFAVMVSQWLDEGIPEDPTNLVWIYVDDPGLPGQDPFTIEVSKYETTNAQYCHFLNAALASGDITVSGNDAIGASGCNSGTDYVGEVYYDGDGLGESYDGATNGGAARINYSGGIFSVDVGFEHHPVTHVSWYGATAFCNYYDYRLPSEEEWRAVADYDGSYNYGCGPTINNNIANYSGSTHPDGTTVVGSFGTYGYGLCDMAGNVWEWVDDATSLFGGSWSVDDESCGVEWGIITGGAATHFASGFRVVLDLN